jgi:hypothetical protein
MFIASHMQISDPARSVPMFGGIRAKLRSGFALVAVLNHAFGWRAYSTMDHVATWCGEFSARLVTAGGSGEDALGMLACEAFDVVVSDVGMRAA